MTMRKNKRTQLVVLVLALICALATIPLLHFEQGALAMSCLGFAVGVFVYGTIMEKEDQ